MAINSDIITYSGAIGMRGYDSICEVLEKRSGSQALLVLSTPGGDPHAGFRIARALQHKYGQFSLLVPRYCKSAGTLIAIGAARLYLDDMSELGPLDIQVKKNDELVGRNSGLDIIAAVEYLRDQAMTSFQRHCTQLVAGAGLSTKAASDISTRLVVGVLEPIAAQIDPMKIAEMQRAMDIAFQYGKRLNSKSNNLRSDGLEMLVAGYPSHGFVIDRKEAKAIFVDVRRPEGAMMELSKALYASMLEATDSDTPVVRIFGGQMDAFGGNKDESTSDAREHAAPEAEPQCSDTELSSDERAPEGDGTDSRSGQTSGDRESESQHSNAKL